MNLHQPPEVVLPAAVALVTEPPSRPWRRRLGPLACVALEHLALSSHLTDQGWVAPMGVRGLATGIGVTKDTAARAVATLRAAGLVVLTRVEGPGGRRRSGYRLHLPEPLQLFDCPVRADSPRNGSSCCPEREYEDRTCCPEGEYDGEGEAEADGLPDSDNGSRRHPLEGIALLSRPSDRDRPAPQGERDLYIGRGDDRACPMDLDNTLVGSEPPAGPASRGEMAQPTLFDAPDPTVEVNR